MTGRRIKLDKAAQKWAAEHQDGEMTVVYCWACGRYYMPTLGHRCTEGEGNDKTGN